MYDPRTICASRDCFHGSPAVLDVFSETGQLEGIRSDRLACQPNQRPVGGSVALRRLQRIRSHPDLCRQRSLPLDEGFMAER
jgi:hypothetical protein